MTQTRPVSVVGRLTKLVVRSKAATFEHLWMGNSKVSATECMTVTEPADTPKV